MMMISRLRALQCVYFGRVRKVQASYDDVDDLSGVYADDHNENDEDDDNVDDLTCVLCQVYILIIIIMMVMMIHYDEVSVCLSRKITSYPRQLSARGAKRVAR